MVEKCCPIGPDGQEKVMVVKLHPEPAAVDYQEAMALAKTEAGKKLGECMLMSWYDSDRDFEAPPNTTEKPGDGPKDGYIHYGLNHGATLKVDIEDGRFVFFFAPVAW